MVEESEVLNKLVVDEKDVTIELEKLVDEASKYFRIEKPTGRIIFQNFGSLNDQQRICTLLVGKYFANQLKMVDNPSLSISEVSKQLGRPMTALSGPMKELITKGFVEKLPGRKYRIAYHRMKEIFENVLGSRPKK